MVERGTTPRWDQMDDSGTQGEREREREGEVLTCTLA